MHSIIRTTDNTILKIKRVVSIIQERFLDNVENFYSLDFVVFTTAVNLALSTKLNPTSTTAVVQTPFPKPLLTPHTHTHTHI